MATATVDAPPGVSASPAVRDQRAYRLSSIDLLRGLVIVIMALDHVRDFFMVAAEQDPLANPDVSVSLFVTRWITHFCAPVFVFLAGTSAGLMAARKTRRDLTYFLLTRGLWLVATEVAIVSTMSTFAPLGIAEVGGTVLIMQVIWAIGAGMIALAVLHPLGRPVCLLLGTALLLTHNLLDLWWPSTAGPLDEAQPLWVALHAQMALRAGPLLFVFVYPVLPWIGVMLAGFGAATAFEREAARRNRTLLRAGVLLTVAFLLLRVADLYGDPNRWQLQDGGWIPSLIDFFNTTKYPPSLLFLLMTLGPAAMLCAYADRWTGRIKNALVTFGRVPFAFYVAHILLIHALSVLLGVIQGFDAGQMLTLFLFYPAGYGVSLPWVYGVWALVIVLLYPFCHWVASVKTRRRDWWLSYV
jgi:uncharacterized membrane protein